MTLFLKISILLRYILSYTLSLRNVGECNCLYVYYTCKMFSLDIYIEREREREATYLRFYTLENNQKSR